MAKTLREIMSNGVNSVMSAADSERGTTNPHYLWGIGQYPKLKAPFNERRSVIAGSSGVYSSSLYYYNGLRNQINSCILSRKAVYKLLHELGYCYKSYANPNEYWVGVYDGNIDEVNQKIDGKDVSCQRMIHMHLKDGQIIGACESDLAGSKPLEFGQKAHSAVSYLFAMLITRKENSEEIGKEWNIVKDKFDRKEFDDEFHEYLTVLENDILIDVSQNVEESRRSYVMVDANELLSQARSDGKRIFDFEDGKSTAKAKIKVKVPKKAMTIAEVASKGLYAISHVFNGDENLVPEEYDTMEFSPQVEEVCGIIKASKSLPFAMNMNFLFTGEAGTGKSTASGQIARVLGVPRRILTCSKGMEEFRITQRLIPNPKKVSEADADFVYVDSEIVEAFKNGGIIEVQEANTLREGVITALNAALDDSGELHLYDGSIIKRHPNCIFIFSMNVGYEGTRNMNQSFLSRCSFKEEFTLPERKVLVKRIVDKYQIDNELAKDMVQAFMDVRTALQESGDTDGVCSYRELVAWVETLKANEEIRKIVPTAPELSVYDAAQRTIVPSAAPKDMDLRAELSGVVAKTFSNI